MTTRTTQEQAEGWIGAIRDSAEAIYIAAGAMTVRDLDLLKRWDAELYRLADILEAREERSER